MGTFKYTIEIGDSAGQHFQILEALVDTGAFFTWIPGSILHSLGIAPSFKAEFVTIDGRILERDIAAAQARINGQTRITYVVFGDEGSEPVIGAYTLEGFLLAPDPVNRRLIPVRGYML